MRILLVLILSAFIGAPFIGGQALAQSDAERAAAQSTIEQQLQAFLRDDGARAYSFAAPNVKRLYPNQEIFMQMVQKGYPPVYRPRSYSFGKVSGADGRLEQVVDIVDAEGGYWAALYTLQQFDGVWQITGCVLLKKPGETA